jgi:hypothetical protein
LFTAIRRSFIVSGMCPSLSFQTCQSTPLVPDPYASLTLAELAAFGIGPSRILPDYDDDDDVEGAANDDEETKDDE